MKNLIIAMICIFGISSSLYAQKAIKKTETFKVYGNCDMCQETIEGALKKKDGILSKSWDSKTKMIVVAYDSSKITLADIKQKIANVGYDMDDLKAKDETYNNLHKCCQYERPKN